MKCTSKVVTSPNFDIFLCWLKYENDLCFKKIGNVDHGADFIHMVTSCISAYSVKSTPRSTLPIYFSFKSFSYFNQQRKISKFGDVTTIDVHFTAKIRPKNSPILMKLGIYNQHTSNQKRTKFY